MHAYMHTHTHMHTHRNEGRKDKRHSGKKITGYNKKKRVLQAAWKEWIEFVTMMCSWAGRSTWKAQGQYHFVLQGMTRSLTGDDEMECRVMMSSEREWQFSWMDISVQHTKLCFMLVLFVCMSLTNPHYYYYLTAEARLWFCISLTYTPTCRTSATVGATVIGHRWAAMPSVHRCTISCCIQNRRLADAMWH